MKVAIIGSGISGLTCGYHLNKTDDITLFEANNYVGGHTATVDVKLEGKEYAIDTGFIVYNDRTYPHFIKMMDDIGVVGIPTQMSFSVRNMTNGLEYNGHTLSTLFAQKRNWFNPRFYGFIREILRFNKLAKRCVDDEVNEEQTLGTFLKQHHFSDYFCSNYILPMGAAIWSSTLADMRLFPLQFFLRFFLNHGLLDVVNRPQWYVIKGGSRAYIGPLTQHFTHRIRLNSPVTSVTRHDVGVTVEVKGKREFFDQVIFACHSDQALKMLSDPTPLECEILGNLSYQANEVILHTDVSLLPKRKAAWASWNYLLEQPELDTCCLPSLTYNMNILQQIEAPETFCVSLNSRERISGERILRRFVYHHPVFSTDSMMAQQRRNEINGKNHTWFCGAYWHNGFHEDGVRSAVEVVEQMSASAQINTRRIQKGVA